MKKNSGYPKIMNIQLISPEDQFYKLYCAKFKTEKPRNVVQTENSTNFTSQLISHALEDTVFKWVNESGVSIDSRIIYFEKYYSKNKFKRFYKELDYVLKVGNKLIIGELKVSNHNPIYKANKQTYESRKLLEKIYKFIEVQVIWIDLNAKYSKEPKSVFDTQFNSSQFLDIDYTDEKYKYKQKIKFLHLDVRDVVRWGVENKIIRTPELLDAALEEAEYIGKIRNLKNEIKNLKKINLEKNDESINDKIVEYKKDIRIYQGRLDLFQKGWTVINKDIELDVFKLIKNERLLFINITQSNDFKTENQKVKFLVFQKPIHSEIRLIHIGKIYYYYHRVLKNDIIELENVFVNFKPDKYPIVNNQGRRKFCYDYNKIDDSQKFNKGLQEFKKIIENADPLRILLSDNEVLIIDNYMMLYKI